MRRRVLLSGGSGSVRRLSIEIELGPDGEPPAEFRLFKAGINSTRNGPYLFDAEAARLTMAAFAEHGTDVMIDLEHLAVAPGEVTGDARNFDPDARGWAKLALRNGELWAVSVSWTPDGVRRLKERTQRYVSPAFDVDGEDRVISIHNIALTATPATDDAFPLVARQTIGKTMKLSEFLKRWHKLSVSQRSLPAGDKLLALLAIDMKTLQSVVKAMGGDPSGDLTSMFSAVRMFADELAASVTGDAAPMPIEGDDAGMLADDPATPTPAPTEGDSVAARAVTDELELLRKSNAERDAKLKLLQTERDERIQADRVELCRQAVATNALRPGQVWQDGEDGKPQAYLNTMTLDGIRQLITTGGGSLSPTLLSVTPRPPVDGSIVTAEPGIEMSEYESKRLRATVDRIRAKDKLPQATDGDYMLATERYQDHRGQQLKWAESEGKHRVVVRYGRKIEEIHTLSTVTGNLRGDWLKLLTNPVQPIEAFGPASQRSLEEFRTEYMVNLAAQLEDWTGDIGDVLSSGSLRTTYPLDFQSMKYLKRTAQAAPASTPQSAEINVNQDEYVLAAEGELKRILRGDFAYLKSWQSKAGQMARARVRLRGLLIITLLEANGLWAPSDAVPAGLDTKNFFATDHAANPFDSLAGTGSNLSGATQPLNADNLTTQKAAMLLVPFFDGIDMAKEASDLFLPTAIAEKARLLLTVQDVILRDSAAKDASAGVTNEHKDSGLGRILAPQLTGAGAASDHYLISRDIIADGFTPWVIAEDPMEEIREWDQNSGYYKDTGKIKIQSHLGMSAVLLWWQGIRKVRGA